MECRFHHACLQILSAPPTLEPILGIGTPHGPDPPHGLWLIGRKGRRGYGDTPKPSGSRSVDTAGTPPTPWRGLGDHWERYRKRGACPYPGRAGAGADVPRKPSRGPGNALRLPGRPASILLDEKHVHAHDEGLKIIDIQAMEPETEDGHPSAHPAMLALEVPEGWFARMGIEVGAQVQVVFGPG